MREEPREQKTLHRATHVGARPDDLTRPPSGRTIIGLRSERIENDGV